MKFLWTTLQVRSIEESVAFYQNVLGLPVLTRSNPPGMALAFLGDGDTQVELLQDVKNPQPTPSPDVSMGFLTPDLDNALAEVKKLGIPIQAGPFSPNPHIRFFYVLDPNGYKIQFVERK
jgi:lactoylglutathione lyase